MLVDENLTFSFHIRHIRSVCYNLINICFRIFTAKLPDTYLLFYQIYILPVVFYCSSVYSFASKRNDDLIEKIQKYFTRRLFWRLYGFGVTPPYGRRLEIFSLERLELLLTKGDLKCLLKIISHLSSVPSLNLKFSSRSPARIVYAPCALSVTRKFFPHRSSLIWNKYFSKQPDVVYSRILLLINRLS